MIHDMVNLPTFTMTINPHVPGKAGFAVRTADIAKSILYDMTSPEGFFLALKGVLRLKQNALLWLGVPCNRILI